MGRRGLVAPERHVDADQGVPAAADDRRAVRAHHLHRHRDGRWQAVDHLPQAVADQQHVAMRVEQLRHSHRVGREHDDRLRGLEAIALWDLAREDRRRGHALARNGHRRRPAGRSIDRESRHGRGF